MSVPTDDLETHKLEVETHKLEVEAHKLELEARNLEVESENLKIGRVNDEVRSYSAAVFWGLVAVGAVVFGALVAIFAGYLLGHFTHVRTKTIARRTVVEHTAANGKALAATAGTSLSSGPTVNLPAAGKMVSIGAGVTGAPGLSATLWAQGPKNAGDVTAGPNGSVFVSTADETGKPDDGVYLVAKGSTKPVEVIKGLSSTLGVVWHDNQLFVSTLSKVVVYTDFNGRSFGAERAILTNLPYGMLGFNDQLILGPDGRFYMGIASPTDHSPTTKQLEATIVSFKPDGSDLQVYSYGVRGNSSLAFLPGTSDLFMATNQRNAPGKSAATPPDEFGLVTQGSDWGYPSCWQQGGPACVGVSHPLVNDDPHAASDGITFIKGQWGAKYGTSAFVSEWTLGKVIRDQLTIKNGVVTATPSVMLTGVANAGPLTTLANGSVLVSSYATGKLYAIRPASGGSTAGISTPASGGGTAATSTPASGGGTAATSTPASGSGTAATSTPASGSGKAATSTPVAATDTVDVRSTAYGNILVNSKGETLYYFAIDKKGKSNCNTGCLQIWPFVTVSGTPTAGPGVNKALLGTIKEGGQNEVTYNGYPLYTYVADGGTPGQTSGEGVNLNGGLWWLVSPSGTPIKQKP